MKKLLIFFLIGSAAAAFGFLVRSRYVPVIRSEAVVVPSEEAMSKEVATEVPYADTLVLNPIKEDVLPEHPSVPVGGSLSGTPFLSQAPTGKWNEPVFQNGCEEASVLMAIFWAEGRSFPEGGTERESLIRAMASDIEKKYGTSHDTSISDLSRFLDGRSAALSVTLLMNVSMDDIREALLSGYGMIVPMDGRVLGNPHYTAPGPERHMLFATGYDRATGDIVTNDPGTKYGEGYRYPESIFYSAIRDYATGDGLPIAVSEKSVMLVRRR